VFLLQNKRPQAIDALKMALRLNPGMPDSASMLADLYADDKKMAEAVQLIRDSLDKNPRDASLFLRSGIIYEKVGRWYDARKSYERVLQLDSENAIAKNNLAWLLAQHGGDMDMALNLAQQAKEQLGNNLQVTNTIGWIYYQKGVYETAWTYLKESADKDKKNAVFQYHLAMACWKLGKFDEARQGLQNALKLDPNFQQAPAARRLLEQL
jgi:Flp pilus assembly protein TadD